MIFTYKTEKIKFKSKIKCFVDISDGNFSTFEKKYPSLNPRYFKNIFMLKNYFYVEIYVEFLLSYNFNGTTSSRVNNSFNDSILL